MFQKAVLAFVKNCEVFIALVKLSKQDPSDLFTNKLRVTTQTVPNRLPSRLNGIFRAPSGERILISKVTLTYKETRARAPRRAPLFRIRCVSGGGPPRSYPAGLSLRWCFWSARSVRRGRVQGAVGKRGGVSRRGRDGEQDASGRVFGLLPGGSREGRWRSGGGLEGTQWL